MIRKEWWHGNPDALGEAEGVADRLDFHVERRKVGDTIPAHADRQRDSRCARHLLSFRLRGRRPWGDPWHSTVRVGDLLQRHHSPIRTHPLVGA